jgi:hypothetical protein
METVLRSNAKLAAILRGNVDVGANIDDFEEIVVLPNPMPFGNLRITSLAMIVFPRPTSSANKMWFCPSSLNISKIR